MSLKQMAADLRTSRIASRGAGSPQRRADRAGATACLAASRARMAAASLDGGTVRRVRAVLISFASLKAVRNLVEGSKRRSRSVRDLYTILLHKNETVLNIIWDHRLPEMLCFLSYSRFILLKQWNMLPLPCCLTHVQIRKTWFALHARAVGRWKSSTIWTFRNGRVLLLHGLSSFTLRIPVLIA
jgi:hypothetical protein